MTAAVSSILAVTNLREFFHERMQVALTRRNVRVAEHTEHYIVNVLASSGHVESAGAASQLGRPLALLLAEACEAATAQERDGRLQRLGDAALFTAGLFSRSFERKLVDVDYHIAMGARAYSTLSQTHAGGASRRAALVSVFGELAEKFQRVVDVLNDIAEASHPPTQQDLMRQYEIYLKTGSPRALEILQQLGVQPTQMAGTRQ